MPSDSEPELSNVVDEEEESEEPEEEPEEEEEEPEEENIEEKSVDSTLDSPSAIVAANNDDSSQEVESKGNDEDLRLEKSKASPVADANDTNGGSCDSPNPLSKLLETQVKELSHVGDEGSKAQAMRKNLLSSKDIEESFSDKKVIGSQPQKTIDIECKDIQKDHETHCVYQDHLCSSISSGADKTKSSCADKKEVEAETLMRDSVDKVSKSNLLLKEDTKQMDMHSEEVIKLKASSSIIPQVRPRSLSPVTEFDDGNKGPAIICRFFARGRCIKGSSCKFLHKKDSVASTSKRAKQGAPAACSENNLQKDEGLRVENRRPFVLSEPLASLDVNGPSLKSNLPSERIRVGEHGESQSNLLLKEDTKQMDMHSEEVIKLKASSSIIPQVRPRSLSPVAEFDDGNKKPAIICRFFARGWCIRGSSCKFLHKNDSVASTSKRAKQGAPAACSADNLKKDEGLRVENRRPFVLSEPLDSLDVNGPSLKSNLPSERIRVGEYGESQRPHQFMNQNDMHSSPVAQGDLRYGSSGNAWPHKIAASGSQWKSFAGDENIRSSAMSNLMDYKRSTTKDFDRRYPSSFKNIAPEHRGLSSGSVPESGMYLNNSYSFALDNRIVEPPSMKLDSRSMPYGSHSSPGLSSSMNSSFNTSLPPTGISPFHQTFPWSGAAPPQRSFPLGPVEPDHVYHASGSAFLLTHSSSPYNSRPDQENFSLRDVPGDSLTSAGHERQSSINNWEPSVPFKPSFHLPSFMASYRSQYNPLRDSFDLPNVGDKAIQEPSVSQGATTRNKPKQLESRNFSYFRRPLYYSALRRVTPPRGMGAPTDLAEGSGSFVAGQQNKSSLSKEDKSLIPGHIVNTSSAMEVDLDHSLNHQPENGEHNREAKTQKIFRAALVEFVKELVKPHWHKGHLSKDAHNTVVKKTVEKVLSTLQPNQIPNTAESTANYFKLFQPKLAKLVEAYVGKYAKSFQLV